ncbi:gas vesicle protein GvpL/GvpF [Streptomyces sp. SLBN-118]|uniref:GvpL/GvpF family gas vesicle protein n=1 Tax=Streptomyces sp. SLBN-118 TaxID=2768454 RepID=UPI00114D84B2|nr:GvpL/GvpF family gas vesicle protein [Streptomyces sp. SLBN-118]TQK42644.1 gas vesicle protein GvpL/GvpF [Streptomyces sp. SLBN-118]
MTESFVTWLYAIAFAHPATGIRETTDLTGVAGEPVHVVEESGLLGIVGSVPVSDFGEEELHERLQDLDWLEAAARAHHKVISTVAREGNIIPLRFATIYHDDDRVHSLLAKRRTDFAAALNRVAGRTEWGIKAYVGPRTLERQEASDTGPEDGGSPGTAYLLRRQAQRQGQETAQREAQDRAEQIHVALRELAVESAHHRPQDARLARYEGSMILNTSYLVPNALTEEFVTAVQDVRGRFPDVRIELVGPWPAYSFTGDDVTPDRT